MASPYTHDTSASIIDNGVFYAGMFALVWVSGIYNWQGWLAGLDIALPLVPLFVLARQSDSKIVPLFVLALGLFKDILAATPFGFWGLLFITFYVLIYSMQRLVVTQGYKNQWLSFTMSVAFIYAIGFAIAIGRTDITAAPLASILSVVMTAILYPPLASLFRNSPIIKDEQ